MLGAGVTSPTNSAAAPALSPKLFEEVSTGVALIRTYTCGGSPIALGSGFLVGDSVVMTARHVLTGACKVRVRVDGDTFLAKRWTYWYGGQSSAAATDLATIKLDRAAADAHIFRIRSTSPPAGTNLSALGYPLGNRLSLNQGKLVGRTSIHGAPIIFLRMLGAAGGSGSAFLDDAGRVVGILQVGLGKDETSGYVFGLDLVRWWGPRARLDLCHAYPNGGIAGCPGNSPPLPKPPPPTPQPPPKPKPPVAQTFTDSTGEDAQAPDITTITVSNDTTGLISFKVNISNRPTITPDMTVLIFLDTDQNTATGDTSTLGADYAIELDPGSVGLFRWNGSDYVATPQSSLTSGYDATGATLRINSSDLGNTRGFNFGVLAISGITYDTTGNPNFTNAHSDAAPDSGHGFFNYRLS